MALKLESDDKKVLLAICGCRGSCSAECGRFETIIWNFCDLQDVNVAGRLAILSTFGKEHLDHILRIYDSGWRNDTWSDGKTETKDSMEAWHVSILNKLETNQTWQTCEVCSQLYKEKKITFGDVIFLPLNRRRCTKHQSFKLH